MPQNKDMKLQWQTINDELVPFTLPQHWDGNDWSITGTDNPLPTGNHVMTEGGVWIPQKGSDDGAVNTQVIGSIAGVHKLLEGETIPPESSLTFHITLKGSKLGVNGRWQSGNDDISASYSFNEYKNESGTRYIGSVIDLFSDINFLQTEDQRKLDMTSPTIMFTIKNNSTDREVSVRHIYITDYYY